MGAGTGTNASPFRQIDFDAALAAGTFRVGGADELKIIAGTLSISVANANSTPITNVSGNNFIKLGQTVFDGTTAVDLTAITTPSGSTLKLINNNQATTDTGFFVVNSDASFKLNAAQASGLFVNGLGSVEVLALQ